MGEPVDASSYPNFEIDPAGNPPLSADRRGTGILRVIGPESFGAVENMSIDQALVDAVVESAHDHPNADADPNLSQASVLRFYTWRVPTLSLGYFQPLDQRRSHQASDSLEVVRRGSGGGAIVHHHELTYSLTVPRKTSMLAEASESLYESVHQCVIQALAGQGVRATTFKDSGAPQRSDNEFLCFRRRTEQDLMISGYKIGGSAQRRGRQRLIQHGSILLAASQFAPELPGIQELTSRSMDSHAFIRAISANIARHLGLTCERSDLTDQEQSQANEIAQNRFGSKAWTHRR